MENTFKKMSSAFARAWRLTMRLPLPGNMMRKAEKSSNEFECAAFVFIGWAGGMTAFLAGLLISSVFNTFCGAFVAALLCWLFMLFHDFDRGDNLLAAKAASLLPGEHMPYHQVVPIFMMIMKFAIIMFIFHNGRGLYLSLITAGIFTMEAVTILNAGFSPPVLNESGRSILFFKGAIIFVVLITFLGSRLGTVLGVLALIFFWKFFSRHCEENGTSADNIRIAGAASEWILLATGTLSI